MDTNRSCRVTTPTSTASRAGERRATSTEAAVTTMIVSAAASQRRRVMYSEPTFPRATPPRRGCSVSLAAVAS